MNEIIFIQTHDRLLVELTAIKSSEKKTVCGKKRIKIDSGIRYVRTESEIV